MFQDHINPWGIQYIYMNQGHWLCVLDYRADYMHTEYILDKKNLIYVVRAYCFRHKSKVFSLGQQSIYINSLKYGLFLRCVFTTSKLAFMTFTKRKLLIKVCTLQYEDRLLHMNREVTVQKQIQTWCNSPGGSSHRRLVMQSLLITVLFFLN